MSPTAVLAALAWPTLERIPLVGDLAVSPHGIGIGIGFLAGAALFRARGERLGLRGDGVEVDVAQITSDVVVRAVIGAVVLGRLAYVVTHADEFLTSVAGVVDVLRLTDGGFSFLGGLTGALLLCVPWLRRQGLRGPYVLDAAAPAVALGLAWGRVGDLVIGDHIGQPAPDWPLAWRCTRNLHDAVTGVSQPPDPYPFDAASPPVAGCFDVAVHQTAFYDFAVALVVLAVTVVVSRRVRDGLGTRGRWPLGTVAASWVLAYAPLRIAGDVLREDVRILGLTGSQWTMLAAAALTTWWLVRARRTAAPPPVDVEAT